MSTELERVVNMDELRRFYAIHNETTIVQAKKDINTVFETLEALVLEYGRGFKLGAIGKLYVDLRPEEEFYDPRNNGEIIKKNPRYVAKFKVNRKFRKELASVETDESDV